MTGSPNEKPTPFDLNSDDIAARKRVDLKRLFPEVFDEDKIDFDQLRRIMGDWVDEGSERFGLTWPGKAACMKVIQAAATGALRPDRNESVKFDETENVFIEGDNLEVLKLLQKAYFDKVRMIYIDPPYNTGGEFIYPDKYDESLETYLAYTGQADEGGRRFSTNSESSGRFHSRWLNMMYSRLYLAKNLLADDGVIAVSIDENELENLRHLMNHIFGEENFIANVTWEKGRKNDSTFFSESVEYVVIFAKLKEYLAKKGRWFETKPGMEEVLAEYAQLREKFGSSHASIEGGMLKFFDGLDRSDPAKKLAHFYRSDERGLYFGGDISSASTSIPDYEVYHPVTGKAVKKPARGWGCTEPVMLERISEDRVHFGATEATIPLKKNYLIETDRITKTPVIYKDGRLASRRLKSLFDERKVFENPKDVDVLADLIEYCTRSEGCLVLDFFAGSGSTGEAVSRLAQRTGQPYQYLLVQLPEPIDGDAGTDDAARKMGLANIAALSRERLRRFYKTVDEGAGAQGYRSFKLCPSSFTEWDADSADGEEDLLSKLTKHSRNLTQTNSEDVLFELLLKDGFPLTTKIEVTELSGSAVYSIADGAFIVCLERDITKDLIESLADFAEKKDAARVVCLDAGFRGNDQLKTNAVQTFKSRLGHGEDGSMFRTV